MQTASLQFLKVGYPALVTLGIWLAFYVVRKKYPAVWRLCFAWVPDDAGPMAQRTLQALPSTVIGAVVLSVGSGMKLGQVALGAMAGACAPLLHHIVKAAPNSYQGALGDEAGKGADIAVPSAGDTSAQAADEKTPTGSPDP